MKELLNKKSILFFSIFTFILSMVTLVYHLIHNGGLGFDDHRWLWAECACTLRGIDSAEAIKQEIKVPGIRLPESTSTFPWTKILGILIHGSFLSYKASTVYYTILNIVILIILFVMVYRFAISHGKNRESGAASVLLMLSCWYFTDMAMLNNNATMLCAMIIMAILLEEEHECVSGVLIAFAMIKAQIVLPFCLLWLLKKKWKLLGTAALIDILCWIASVLITGVSPITQLSNVINMRVEMTESYLVYGIFDGLRSVGVPSKAVLLMSMIFGCIVVVIGYYLTEKLIPAKYIWLRWSVPAVVSVFWCYKSQCDYVILMIVSLALVELWMARQDLNTALIIFFTSVFLLMKPISLLSGVLDVFGVVDRNGAYYTVNRVDLYCKCLIYAVYFVFAIMVLKRKENESIVP